LFLAEVDAVQGSPWTAINSACTEAMMATLPKKREQDRKQVLSSTRQGKKEHAQHLLKRHRQEAGLGHETYEQKKI